MQPKLVMSILGLPPSALPSGPPHLSSQWASVRLKPVGLGWDEDSDR
jgi:hypothetical protein